MGIFETRMEQENLELEKIEKGSFIKPIATNIDASYLQLHHSTTLHIEPHIITCHHMVTLATTQETWNDKDACMQRKT